MSEKIHELIEIIIIIVIDIFIVLLAIVLAASAKVCLTNDFPETVEKLDPKTLRTGDIVGVAYTNPFGYFISTWSGSIWSHIGIYWQDPDDGQSYIIEAAQYNSPYKGIFMIPLSLWAKINRKSYLGVTRINGEPIDPDLLKEIYEKRKVHVLDSYNWRWYRLLMKKPYQVETRNYFTCYELAITILQDAGVVKKDYSCSSYFPNDIMEGRVNLENGFTWEKPVLFDVNEYLLLADSTVGPN